MTRSFLIKFILVKFSLIKFSGVALLLLVGVFGPSLASAQLSNQLANQLARKQLIEVLSQSTGLSVEVGALEGSLLSSLSAQDLRFSDESGPVLEVGSISFDWVPKRLIQRELVISNLQLGDVRVRRRFSLTGATADPLIDVATDDQPLEPLPEQETYNLFGFDLPRLPVTILVERFDVARLQLDAPLFDREDITQPVAIRAEGALLVPHTDQALELAASVRRVDAVQGEIRGRFAYQPSSRQLVVSTLYSEGPGGLFQTYTPIAPARGVAFTLDGQGPINRWSGGTRLIIDRLVQVEGQVTFEENDTSQEQQVSANVSARFGDELRRQYPGLFDDLAKLNFNARYQDNTVVVLDSFDIDAPAIKANGLGSLNVDTQDYDFNFALNSDDLSPLAQLVGIQLAGAGDLRVEVQQQNQDARLSIKGLVENFQVTNVSTPRAQLDVIVDNPPLVSTGRGDANAPLEFAISLITRELGLGPVQLVSADRDLDLFAAGEARIAGDASRLTVPVITLNLPGIEGRGVADLSGARFADGSADFTLAAPDLTNVKATREFLTGGSAIVELGISGGSANVRADASGLRWRVGQQAAVLGSDLLIETQLDLTAPEDGVRVLPLQLAGDNINGTGRLSLGDVPRLRGNFDVDDLSAIEALATLIDDGGYSGAVDVRLEEKRTRVSLDGRATDLAFGAEVLGELIGDSAPVQVRLTATDGEIILNRVDVSGRALALDLSGEAGEGKRTRIRGDVVPNELFALLDDLPVELTADEPVGFLFEGPNNPDATSGGFVELIAPGIRFTGDLTRLSQYIGSTGRVETRWPVTPAGLLLGSVLLETDAGVTADVMFNPAVATDQLSGEPGTTANAKIALTHSGVTLSHTALDRSILAPVEADLSLSLRGSSIKLGGAARITSGAAQGTANFTLLTDRDGRKLDVSSVDYQGALGVVRGRASLETGTLTTLALDLGEVDLALLQALESGQISGQLTIENATQIASRARVTDVRLAGEDGPGSPAGLGVDIAQFDVRLPEAAALLERQEGEDWVLAAAVSALPMVGRLALEGLTGAPDDRGETRTFASALSFAFEGLGDRLAIDFDATGAPPEREGEEPLTATGNARVEGLARWATAADGAPKGMLRAALEQLNVETSVGSLSLGAPARLEITQNSQRLSLPLLSGAGVSIRAEGEVAGGQVLAQASVDIPDIAGLPGMEGFADVEGRAKARLNLSGPADNPSAIGDFSVSNLNLVQALENNPLGGQLPQLDVSGTLRLTDGAVFVDGRATGPRDLRASLSVGVPVRANFEEYDLGLDASRALSGRATGIMRLVEVAEYLDLDGDTLEGTLRLDTSITGTTDKPALDGQFSVTDATYESFASGLIVEDLNIVGRADGQSLRFESAAGSAVTTQGVIRLGEDDGTPLEMTLSFARQNLLVRDDLNAILSGQLSVEGLVGRQLNVSGRVDVDEAEFSLAANGLGDLPNLEVVEINRPGNPLPFQRQAPNSSNVFTNINIRADDNIVFRGGGVNTRWGALLQMQGPINSPFLTGNITNADGRLTVLGNEFFVTRGDVSYSQDPIAEPRLDLQAERQAGDLLVLLTLSGAASNPTIELSSVPELPTDEILAGLLFGEDITELTGIQAAELAIALLRLQSIGRDDDIIERVRTLVNLDQLILSADENDVTRLRAGKRIADPVLLWGEQGLELDSGRVGVRVDILPGLNSEADIGVDGDARLQLNWSQNF